MNHVSREVRILGSSVILLGILAGCGGTGIQTGSGDAGNLLGSPETNLAVSWSPGNNLPDDSISYELENGGEEQLEWQASTDVNWVQLSPPLYVTNIQEGAGRATSGTSGASGIARIASRC